MIYKKTLLVLISLITIVHAYAQDRIYKKDGSEIIAIIKENGEQSVTYKKYDNPTGPDYVLLKTAIDHIVYQQGNTENIAPTAISKKHRVYGKNIFSLTPISAIGNIDGDNNMIAVGVNYERVLDKKGYLSVTLPVTIGWTKAADYSYYTNNYSNAHYVGYSFMPGIKIYPGTCKGVVKYALGVSLYFISGNEPYGYYANTGGYSQQGSVDQNYFVSGCMITNAIILNPTPHIYIESVLGFGLTYYDNRIRNNDLLDDFVNPLAFYALKIGYRF